MTDAEVDDSRLVHQANGGDRDALELLVQRHQAWVYNVAVRMLGHPHDAEDATQEIFIKAVTRLSSFEGRSTFRTWLYRIVVNHVLNMKRGRLERQAVTFNCYAHGLDKKKTRGFIEAGYVDPANLVFASARITQVREAVPATARAVATLDEQCGRVYREHPFYEPPDIADALRRLIDSADFRHAVDLS